MFLQSKISWVLIFRLQGDQTFNPIIHLSLLCQLPTYFNSRITASFALIDFLAESEVLYDR